MIPFACNFVFSLWENKMFAAPFLIFWIRPTVNSWTPFMLKVANSVVIFWLTLPPAAFLLMPTECYRSISVFSSTFWPFPLRTLRITKSITGRQPSCWGYCSGLGGPSSLGCRLLRRWRFGFRVASPPAWHLHRCSGRWTAWRALC